MQKLAFFLHLRKAVAAVHRTVFAGLEGHAGFLTAGGTHSGEHLAGATAGVLAGVTAGLAALRLVLEATACIELLLTGSEHELVAAIFAYQGLVFVQMCIRDRRWRAPISRWASSMPWRAPFPRKKAFPSRDTASWAWTCPPGIWPAGLCTPCLLYTSRCV